jgi:hypothetical protein
MVIILNLKLLKAKRLIILLALLSSIGLDAQELTKIKTIELKAPPQSISIDRQGNFYIATRRGEIDKYDIDGNLTYQFSPQKRGNATLVEAWQGPSVFLYYKDFQEVTILDRFLSNSKHYALPEEFSSFSSLTTISGDGNLWLIDSQSLSLKKIDIPSNQAIIDNPFNFNFDSDAYSFSHIREYQNQLFISDPNQGLMVFDLFGNFSELIKIPGIEYFNFVNDELIYLHEQKAVLINVYNKQKREIRLPDLSYKYILMENNLLICVTESKVDLFQFN